MFQACRLTDEKHAKTLRERAKDVPESELMARLGVGPKTVCNVLSHGRAVTSTNGSRSRVLTMPVSEDDLRWVDAARSRRGIAHRSNAMHRLDLEIRSSRRAGCRWRGMRLSGRSSRCFSAAAT